MSFGSIKGGKRNAFRFLPAFSIYLICFYGGLLNCMEQGDDDHDLIAALAVAAALNGTAGGNGSSGGSNLPTETIQISVEGDGTDHGANGAKLIAFLVGGNFPGACTTRNYVLEIAAGTFSLGNNTLVMLDCVSLKGQGIAATTITAAGGTNGTIRTARSISIESMTVANTGVNADAIAVYNASESATVSGTALSVTGGTSRNYGVFQRGSGASLNMSNTTVAVAAPGDGIFSNAADGAVTLNLNGVIVALNSAADSNYGLKLQSGTSRTLVNLRAGLRAQGSNMSWSAGDVVLGKAGEPRTVKMTNASFGITGVNSITVSAVDFTARSTDTPSHGILTWSFSNVTSWGGTTLAGTGTTINGGNLATQTWTPGGSPYRVQGDITIPAAVTLTIQAGTTVLFENTDNQAAGIDTGRVELIVAGGTLNVTGTTASPVTFADASGTPGSWYGLVINNASAGLSLANLNLGYSLRGIDHDSTGAYNWTNVIVSDTLNFAATF